MLSIFGRRFLHGCSILGQQLVGRSCLLCGAILKTAVVYFGEMLPEGAVEEAFDLADRADAVLSVGSTLTVFPAAYVPLKVARRGRPFVILNMGPTDFDHLASVRLESRAGTALPALVAALA